MTKNNQDFYEDIPPFNVDYINHKKVGQIRALLILQEAQNLDISSERHEALIKNVYTRVQKYAFSKMSTIHSQTGPALDNRRRISPIFGFKNQPPIKQLPHSRSRSQRLNYTGSSSFSPEVEQIIKMDISKKKLERDAEVNNLKVKRIKIELDPQQKEKDHMKKALIWIRKGSMFRKRIRDVLPPKTKREKVRPPVKPAIPMSSKKSICFLNGFGNKNNSQSAKLSATTKPLTESRQPNSAFEMIEKISQNPKKRSSMVNQDSSHVGSPHSVKTSPTKPPLMEVSKNKNAETGLLNCLKSYQPTPCSTTTTSACSSENSASTSPIRTMNMEKQTKPDDMMEGAWQNLKLITKLNTLNTLQSLVEEDLKEKKDQRQRQSVGCGKSGGALNLVIHPCPPPIPKKREKVRRYTTPANEEESFSSSMAKLSFGLGTLPY